MRPNHEVAKWAKDDRTMVALGVSGEEELKEWESRLAAKGVKFETFVEPDRNGEKTALAVWPTENGTEFGGLKLL